MRRALPAVGLFFLAPLVAEFLLGNLPITLLGALVVLAPMYGGGALLIRETARRTGRGWPTMIVLAFAYAVFEEAFTTQTLFNPNYLHLNLGLLKPAYIPALGIGAWWTVFVLTLHTVWSISTSIALVEAVVPNRSSIPWLGRLGVIVTGVLFIFGAAVSTRFSLRQDTFVASVPQFVCSALVCLVAAVVAFCIPRTSPHPAIAGNVPNPWLVGAGALLAGSTFLMIPMTWAWWAVVAYLTLDLLVIAAVWRWSPRQEWNSMHRLALAGGAALAYAWHAFVQTPAVGQANKTTRIGNAVFAVALIILLAIAARQNTGHTAGQEASAATLP